MSIAVPQILDHSKGNKYADGWTVAEVHAKSWHFFCLGCGRCGWRDSTVAFPLHFSFPFLEPSALQFLAGDEDDDEFLCRWCFPVMTQFQNSIFFLVTKQIFIKFIARIHELFVFHTLSLAPVPFAALTTYDKMETPLIQTQFLVYFLVAAYK